MKALPPVTPEVIFGEVGSMGSSDHEHMTRDEFVRQTVSGTLAQYLQRYCAPYTIRDAQDKCIADACALADRLFGGTIDMVSEAAPGASKLLPASNGASHVYNPETRAIVPVGGGRASMSARRRVSRSR
ncbi:MAG TPA: hypothetical protein VJ376_17015 [Pseudomonadota bacterium]|nr:hypothetical protein [Pseudomonadota bacterium]